MKMSIALFHPSVAPFVQQAARAFEEAGWLDRFYTTLYDDPRSPWQRTASVVAASFGRDLRGQLGRRAVTEIPLEKVTSFPLAEIARLLSGKIDRSGRLTDSLWERAERRFARKVARRLSRDLSAVYGYEFSSLAAFERARELGLRIYYDVPAPSSEYVVDLLRHERERFPELESEYTRHTAAREARRTAHRKREFELANIVIAASQFTRESFARNGEAPDKIRVVPYGAPPPVSIDATRRPAAGEPVRFIWAGTFSVRKGAHYLLEAWRNADLGRHAQLDVFGTIALPDRVMSPLPPGIAVHGPVSRDALFERFRESDALVFPTLCDGFGLVVTEAWSQGLPVITTRCAGAADLLKPNGNGLLVEPADAEQLANTLGEVIARPTAIRALREFALASAARWQWSDYRRALVQTITESSA